MARLSCRTNGVELVMDLVISATRYGLHLLCEVLRRRPQGVAFACRKADADAHGDTD